MTADTVIKTGFWLQLVFLALVDWATVTALLREPELWYHFIGLAVVNAVLLTLAVMMWRWLRGAKGRPC